MTNQLCTRNVELRADAQTGVVEGIAVPWNTPTKIRDWMGDYEEQFERGAVDTSSNVRLFWQHQDVMGRVLSMEDRDEGLWISAQISDTSVGRDARALLKDGAVDSFSVGFIPVEHRDENDGALITRTKVDLKEVSAVTFPAYPTATIDSVRHASTPNPEKDTIVTDSITPEDLAEVREKTEDIERRLSTFAVRTEEPAVDHRSVGQIVKALASGDEATRKHYDEMQERAYEGGTLANAIVKDAWVGDLTRIIDDASPLRAVFSKGTLPATGMSIEYGQLKSNSVVVGKQANEGDDLPYGEVVVETKTAPVETYGGYSQLSRQAIERATVNILTTTLEAQASAAGKALNTKVRTEFVAEVATQKAAGNFLTVPADADYADWLDALVDAAGKYQDLGLGLDGLIVDKATFKSLVRLEGSDGRPVFLVTGAGTNNVGAVNVKALTGDIAGVQIVLDPKLAAGNNAFYNARALREYGSPLVRLQDDNIINLSRDFSIYTYEAVAHEIPAGIVPVGAAA